MKIPTRTSAARGFSLLEVLISMFVLAMGLLGLAGLQTRVSVAEMESYQRTQALILVQDMVDRIATNGSAVRKDIADKASPAYATGLNTTDVGASDEDCAGKIGAKLDLCEWGNQIAGVSEKNGSSENIGTLTNGRGCIRQPDEVNDPYLYLVVVSWQGRIASKAPPAQIDCGSGNYTADNKRRVVALPVRIANLANLT